MKYIEGEQVLAKHPVLLEYHRATVLGIRGDRYKIKFDTGGEHTLNETDIQYQRASRSTNRISSRVSKSPSRFSPGTKSPGRPSPSRRSPSRRSPSRRSPGRSSTSSTSSRKLPDRNTRFAKISLARVDYDESNHKEEISTQALEAKQIETIPLQQRLNEINTENVRRYRVKQFSNVKSEYESSLGQLTRNTDRAVSLPLERNIYVHDYLPEETNRGNLTQRDQTLKKWEEIATREEICKVDKPQEWGGWIGTSLLTFILPLSLILPQLLFWKKNNLACCEFVTTKFSTNLKSYVHLHGLLAYGLFLTLLAFASILPIGKTVDGMQSKIGRLRYRINGFPSFIATMIAFGLCLYKKVPIDDYILNNIVQLSVSGWILGTVLALGLYVKAGRAPIAHLNIYASTNSKMYNFWQGREINPRIGTLDIKLLLIRASFIGTLIVHLAIFVNYMKKHPIFLRTDMVKIKDMFMDMDMDVDVDVHLNVAALLLFVLQSFYIVVNLIEEDTLLTSFEIMYEGTGYMMSVSRLLYPFLMTLTMRFILFQNAKSSFFGFIFILSYAMGFSLYRASNLSKNSFRKNPVAPAVSCFKTISTLRGKKLILAAGWSYVRHPNYLGNIIIHWSFAAISLTAHILPYYPAIWFTLMLAYRAVRDNRRCQTRYGYAWEQYCSRVKYMILKGVF